MKNYPDEISITSVMEARLQNIIDNVHAGIKDCVSKGHKLTIPKKLNVTMPLDCCGIPCDEGPKVWARLNFTVELKPESK